MFNPPLLSLILLNSSIRLATRFEEAVPTVDATTNAGTATMSAVTAASATVVVVIMTVTATVAIVTAVTVIVATVTVTTVAATGPDLARARSVDAGMTTTATAAGTVMEDAPRTEIETPGSVEPPAALRPPRATTVNAREAHAAPAALAVIERNNEEGKEEFY